MKKEKWVKELDNKDSAVNIYTKSRLKTFFKYQFWLQNYAIEILGEESKTTQSLKKKHLPFSKLERTVMFIQNKQFPKNSFKKEAINDGEYVSINKSGSSAEDYIISIIKDCTSIISKKAATKVKNLILARKLRANAKKFNKTEDLEEAESLLKGVKKGRGDMSIFFKNLSSSGSAFTMDKIKLINSQQLRGGEVIYSDKNGKNYVENQNGLSQKKVFSLWVNVCKKMKSVSEEEFFEYFESYKSKREWWNNYFDGNGEQVVKNNEATRAKRRGKKAAWRKRRQISKFNNAE